MEYFVEQALSYTECLNKIRTKYGERVTILYHKNIRIGGIFGLFAKDGVEITGFTANNYAKNLNVATPASSIISSSEPKKTLDFHEEKKRLVEMGNAVKKEDPTLAKVLEEMKSIKEKLNVRAGDSADHEQDSHSTLVRLREALELNDFSQSYIQNIIERCKKEISLEGLNNYDAVQDKALEWIGETILIYKEAKIYKRPRIMVLVGPTGVGKTTTIAKLAAIYGIGNSVKPPVSVRMITIDAFRIGAKAQIEAYGNIMELPVSYVEDYDDLKRTIAQYSDEVDLILVDTIGKSPRDSAKLGEMKQLLDACGPHAEIHLAVAATTKSSDIKEILRQFEPFNYRSVIITKLDETIRMGNVISAISEKGKLVSYITDGQKVPSDIQKASVVRFLINLEGFHVKRSKIEERFPHDDAEQIQWRK
ncbi:MAG: flagellar biosynthesis protein FlhF [Treponema sp.]|nr:flagellar biosynthesis protein FlhF [Treponema sp.]